MNKFTRIALLLLIATLVMSGCVGRTVESPGAQRQIARNGDPEPTTQFIPQEAPPPAATPTPLPEPTAPRERVAVVSNNLEPMSGSQEIVQKHINPGLFTLRPGESVNAGHVYVRLSDGKGYIVINALFVDNKVVVVTNESTVDITGFLTDGGGWSNTTLYDLTIKMRFFEGCDQDGCGCVLWIRIFDDGEFEITTICIDANGNFKETKWSKEEIDSILVDYEASPFAKF